MMRRALAIDEHSFGPDHPNVARDLDGLSRVLQVTSQHDEAEALSRRALAIDERSFSPDHPVIARDLHTLARVLKMANRAADAEPVSRRAASILLDYTRRTGFKHPHLQKILDDYEAILKTLGHSEQTFNAFLADYCVLPR